MFSKIWNNFTLSISWFYEVPPVETVPEDLLINSAFDDFEICYQVLECLKNI